MKLGPNSVLICAGLLCEGAAIAWVDNRPNWDDTGITAAAVVITAAAGALGGVSYWLNAVLTVIPLLVVELPSGAGVLLAVPLAVGGALLGRVGRRLIWNGQSTGGS